MSGFGFHAPTTETCMHCGGTGGELAPLMRTFNLTETPPLIPDRSEWVGCHVCHQTGRVAPDENFAPPTLGGVPILGWKRKQVAPGGSR